MEVQLRPSPSNGNRVIYLARNGDPLPKSAFDMQSKYDDCVVYWRVIAGAYIVGGLLSLIGVTGFLVTWTGGSIASLIAGILFIGMTFAPDDKKRLVYMLGVLVALGEAYYFFTHPWSDQLPVILRLGMIIQPIVCAKLFGDAQRQAQESAARKLAVK